MKGTKLILLIAMVLWMTIAVTAQLPEQGQSQPVQPVFSLDFAQHCIGDSWKLSLSNGAPDMPMRLLGNSNGQSWQITDWGKTDESGNFMEEGMFAVDAVGNHTLQLDIGGILSNTVYFVVSECKVKGSRIAFVSTRDVGGPGPGARSSRYIYVANADGSGVTRLTQGEMPIWSPDGQRIAFSSERGEIRIINADGSNERVLGPGGMPSWSPDGTRIVFYSGNPPGESTIFMMNADGSSVTKLITIGSPDPGSAAYVDELPSWSPDGQSIAFVRASDEYPWTVHILNLVTSEDQFLRVGLQPPWESRAVGDSRPAWSPDGRRLLLQVAAWSIASIDKNFSDLQTYVQGTYLGKPDWSPDGKSIVYEKFTAPGGQSSRMRIFIASLEDGTVRQLIPEAVAPASPDYWDSQPSWSRVRQ